MHLRQIEIFQAVMSTGSLRDAARLLGVSLPAVSKLLRHVEDQLRFRLFERVKGRLVPTAEAHALHGEVETLLARVATVRETAGLLRSGLTGHLRVTATPALALNVLPTVVAEFAAEFPALTFALQVRTLDGLLPSLITFRNDFGFALAPPPTPGIAVRVLREADLVALMPADYALARPERLRLSDLIGWPLLGVRREGPLGLAFARACEEAGVHLPARVTMETSEMARALVEKGVGLAVVDTFTAAAAAAQGCLAYRPFDPPVRVTVAALHPEYRPISTAAERFIDRFAAAVAAYP